MTQILDHLLTEGWVVTMSMDVVGGTPYYRASMIHEDDRLDKDLIEHTHALSLESAIAGADAIANNRHYRDAVAESEESGEDKAQ